jgi:hypothetical protein
MMEIKIIVWTKKNIEEKPKIFYAVSEKQNPPKNVAKFLTFDTNA